ncbi:MAG: glutathione S-transferase family protein, partial [Solirubrobacterales bacterium]|nr:glutathione S-transferase family protein [Solirubrobacterales bacterium]
MPNKVYIVYGSHPCNTVLRALDLKSVPYKVVELPPPMHAPVQQLMFGKRTVPGLKLEGGEKIVGSRAILRRLDELAPEPALLPADTGARAAVLRAEEWGDEVLQPIARRLLWPALKRRPEAIPSYQEGSRLPPVPGPVLKLLAPGIARIEIAMNDASEGAVRADLQALPGHLDRVDAWIAEGVMGGEQPNAADLQIAPTLGLLMTIGDVRPLIAGRPAGELARRHFPDVKGAVPAGAYPPGWLPTVPAAA